MARQPSIDAFGHRPQGHVAVLEHDGVELARVERIAQRTLRTLPLREDVLHAHHERRRLPGNREVAVHGALVAGARTRRVPVEVGDGLVARPALVVQAAVHDEPRGAPQLGRKTPEIRVRVLEEAQLLAQALRVERPALDEGGVLPVAAHLAQFGDGGIHEDARDLQVVTRHGLVIEQRLELVQRTRIEPREVERHDAGTAAVRGAPHVEARGRTRGAVVGRRPDLERQRRRPQECHGQLRLHGRDDFPRAGEVGRATGLVVREVEAPVRLHLLHETLEVALVAHLRHDGGHLAMGARDLPQPQLVHLSRGHVRGRVLTHEESVERVALRQLPDPAVHRRARCVGLERFDHPGVRGAEVLHQCRACAGKQSFSLSRGQSQGRHLRGEVLEHRRGPLRRGPVLGRHAVAQAASLAGDDRVHGTRHVHAVLRLQLEALHQPAEVVARGGHAPQPRLGVGRGLDLLGTQHLRDVDRRARDLVERIEMIAPAITVEQQFLRALEDAVLHARLRLERRIGELAAHHVEFTLRSRGARGGAGLAERLPAIVALRSALLGRHRGVFLQLPLVGSLQVGEEALVGGRAGVGSQRCSASQGDRSRDRCEPSST